MAATKAAAAKGFDPSAHARTLNGSEYLDVKWRIVWLRVEHPDASIVVDSVTLTSQIAVFRATVSFPIADDQSLTSRIVSAVGHGSETPGDFRDYIEKAETKAIGRALQHLGYGAASMPDDEAIVDAAVDRSRNAARDQNKAPKSNGTADKDAESAAQPNAAQSDEKSAAANPDNLNVDQVSVLKEELKQEVERTGATPETMNAIVERYAGVTDYKKMTIAVLQKVVEYLRRRDDGTLTDESLQAAVDGATQPAAAS